MDSGGSSIPGLDSDAALYTKDKLKFMLEDKADERGSGRRDKKKRKQSSHSSGSKNKCSDRGLEVELPSGQNNRPTNGHEDFCEVTLPLRAEHLKIRMKCLT